MRFKYWAESSWGAFFFCYTKWFWLLRVWVKSPWCRCDHLNESCWEILSFGAVYHAVIQNGSYFLSDGNPQVWPFQGKLLSSSCLSAAIFPAVCFGSDTIWSFAFALGFFKDNHFIFQWFFWKFSEGNLKKCFAPDNCLSLTSDQNGSPRPVCTKLHWAVPQTFIFSFTSYRKLIFFFVLNKNEKYKICHNMT